MSMKYEDLLLKLLSLPSNSVPSEGMLADSKHILQMSVSIEIDPVLTHETERYGASGDSSEYIYFSWEKGDRCVTLQIQRESSRYASEHTTARLWRGVKFKQHRGFTIKSGRTYAEAEDPNPFDFLATNSWLSKG